MPMPNAHAHAGTCSHSADAAGHEAASSSSTSDESDTCLDDSSLAGYCPCQMMLYTRHLIASRRCCKTCSTRTSVQSPVILSCKHNMSVCLTTAVHL